jgi:hypothetical protein
VIIPISFDNLVLSKRVANINQGGI